MTYPVALHPPNSKAVRHTLRSRSHVLTRRNASDAAFMRMLWADPVFMRSFHRLAPAFLVFANNPHSLKGTLHLGFKQEGLLRRHTLDPASQTYVDVIQTGLLAEEAFSPSNIRLMKKLLETPI